MKKAKETLVPGQRKFIEWLEEAANTVAGQDTDLERRHFAKALYVRVSAWSNWKQEIREIPLTHARLFAYRYGLNWKQVCKQGVKYVGSQKWQDELKGGE